MAKSECRSHSDVVSVLSNQDARENEFLGLDLTKPASTWLDRIARRLHKAFRSKDNPINENDIRRAIKKEYGKFDERKALATKFTALLENNPALEEIMENFLWLQHTSMEKEGKVKFGVDEITKEKLLI